MEFRVKLSKAPFSARKAKYVLDLIRGKGVNAALEILQFCHRRPARAIEKLIRSCMANVEYINESEAKKGEPEVDVDTLVLTEARGDEGPLLGYARRFMPRARGMAFPLNLRTCHIKLILTATEEKEEEEKEEKAVKSKKAAKAQKAVKEAKTEKKEKEEKEEKEEKKEKATADVSEKPGKSVKKRARKAGKTDEGEDN
jgi:large subunit ribosomal protein L22